ncbi:MAG: TRC40/GET3/ArsA family transport-energizing ATPase [Myxococcaceae bacterium]|nr:TRC40/GET3/ArsA family transport-energizing ATPase [Myxococcaceae bacterium]MCA3015672.1 TRC40/GET3/ArsA family transport-energizing ATPase [Myxococcaceae bacterium]
MADGPVLHFFAGKGGAGKTTLSTAHAISTLDDDAKARVLLVALEADSGLSDLLKKKLSAKPTRLLTGKGPGALAAVELDLPALAEAFNKKWRPALLGSAQKGAVLSEDDLKKLLETSTARMGEVAALVHLIELAESGEYDAVVVDGFSTSHALRFLDHASTLRRFIALLRGERHGRPSKNAVRPPLPVDAFAARADAAVAFLKDPKKFALHVCTVAEPVAEAQTKLLFKVIGERGIPAEEIVVDMIEDGKASREVANRRGLQAPHVRKYQSMHPKVALLQRRIVGPRGLDEVKAFAAEWASGKETKALQFGPAEAPPALVRAPSMPPIAAPPLPPTRFIFFVGAGGVGKSSCAAAAAVTLTEKEGPVLLLSTDPSHSLSDVLVSRLTDTETQVKGTKGLYAREIDFAVWFTALRKKLKELAEPMFGPEAKGEAFAQDRELFRNLFELAPIGMDELAAMMALTDALVQERFKRIVIDPAPAGNTLRVLEVPAIAREWFKAIHAVATKYKAKGGAALMAWCEAQLKHIDRFEKALVNPAECRFVVVTRGEELGVPVMERQVDYLKDLKLPFERVLVNRVLPKTTCPVTEERRKNQLEVAKVVEKKIGFPVTLAPELGRHPAQLRALKEFRTSWYALTPTAKVKAA